MCFARCKLSFLARPVRLSDEEFDLLDALFNVERHAENIGL
jgi:hypothetical protein